MEGLCSGVWSKPVNGKRRTKLTKKKKHASSDPKARVERQSGDRDEAETSQKDREVPEYLTEFQSPAPQGRRFQRETPTEALELVSF